LIGGFGSAEKRNELRCRVRELTPGVLARPAAAQRLRREGREQADLVLEQTDTLAELSDFFISCH